MGGFGSAVLEALQEHNVQVPVKRFGVPDSLVDHATQTESKASLGLSSPQMAENILKSFFDSKDKEPSVVG